MWILCMFDMPVKTHKQRKNATQFRTLLLNDGFMMKQFSVYIKPCARLESAKHITKKLKYYIPDDSMVSFFYITDKQYATSDNFIGKNSIDNEQKESEKTGNLQLF